MSKILKAVLIGAYGALITQFLRTFTEHRQGSHIEINYLFRQPGLTRMIEKEIIKNKNKKTQMVFTYEKPKRLPTDLKYILKYTEMVDMYFKYEYFKSGQKAFIENKCEYHNCYFTTSKGFLMDVRNFDAIIFDAENYWDSHPVLRAPHQKYIFAAFVSCDFSPICNPNYENYYNWTWSYKLNSDIVWTHFTIYDRNNTVVGPKINMSWTEPMAPTPSSVIRILGKKKKMAAWFASDCGTKSRNMNMTRQIEHHLSKFGFSVDIFGQCGSTFCQKQRMEDCLDLLEKDYFFYFAFEKTVTGDYVTEQLLHAVQHYTMPVVYGGADYSRYLPPGSYIDASAQEPAVTAHLMMDLINSPYKQKYYDCFRWHNHYIYKTSSGISGVCEICKLLNEEKEPTVVKNLREWWHPKYREICETDNVEQTVDYLKKIVRHIDTSQF